MLLLTGRKTPSYSLTERNLSNRKFTELDAFNWSLREIYPTESKQNVTHLTKGGKSIKQEVHRTLYILPMSEESPSNRKCAERDTFYRCLKKVRQTGSVQNVIPSTDV